MFLRGFWATCPLLIFCASLSSGAENQTAIKDFGASKSKPLNTSFFFWNYQYVEAPYFVERRGLDVFINGIQVHEGPEWPQEDATVKDDPGDPPPDYRVFDFKSDLRARKWGYLSGKYELNEACRMMVEFYRKCSDVADVSLKPNSGAVRITSKDGKKLNVLLTTYWKDAIRSKEELLQQAFSTEKAYERELAEVGALLSMGTNIPEVRIGALKVLGIMLSDLPTGEKIKRLKEEKLLVIPEIGNLVTECRRNEQLIKRFAMLKNGELEAEPPEPPAWLAEAQEKSRQVAARAAQAVQPKAEQNQPQVKTEQKEAQAETKKPVEQNGLETIPPKCVPQKSVASKNSPAVYAWSAGGLAFLGFVLYLLCLWLRRK